jgi:hypothetical protein
MTAKDRRVNGDADYKFVVQVKHARSRGFCEFLVAGAVIVLGAYTLKIRLDLALYRQDQSSCSWMSTVEPRSAEQVVDL